MRILANNFYATYEVWSLNLLSIFAKIEILLILH